MRDITNIVNAKEFQRALEKVLKVAPKKSRLSFLLDAHVSFNGDTCTLTCTDLELWCQATIPAQGGQCAFVLKDSRKFLTACKYFSGDMAFTYQEDDPPETFPTRTDLDGSLTLCCGTKELHRRVTTAEHFPNLPELETEHTYTVDSAALSKRFERIKYALANDTSRPCNQCVQFFDNRIGAVDGHRLALNRDESLCVDEPFFIPPAAMKLLSLFDGSTCQLSVGKRHAVFDNRAVRVITPVPKGNGLNFDSAIPKDFKEEHTVEIDDFADSLRYLDEFIFNRDREPVRLDEGVLSVKNITGEYRSKLNLAEVPKIVIGFKGYYMLDGLKQFQAKKLKTVSMQMSTPAAPIILTDQEDLAMVLPFHLKKAA